MRHVVLQSSGKALHKNQSVNDAGITGTCLHSLGSSSASQKDQICAEFFLRF